MGISLTNSSKDKINGNTVLQSGGGILLTNSSNNIVTGNSVSENFPWAIILPLIYPLYMGIGIDLGSSSNNTISENYIAENWWGIVLDSSSYNSVYHNAFFENNGQASVELQSVGNVWDNGYPSGGNYWSDYNGTDLYSGPFQNVTGSDGIGDTPYFIEPILDTYDIDYYPLMRPMLVLVTEITTSNRWVYQGQPININVTVSNIGSSPENVWVTLYYNISASKSIDSYPIDLDAGQSFTFQFKWNTAGTPCLNYTLAAMTTISATISAGSNTFTDGNVTIRLMGDVNGDGVVDLRDIALVARAFGSTPSSPNWNPAADINGDGVVNMKDITLVARNFGEHYP
jgi:parallel beta-helix repeat protein